RRRPVLRAEPMASATQRLLPLAAIGSSPDELSGWPARSDYRSWFTPCEIFGLTNLTNLRTSWCGLRMRGANAQCAPIHRVGPRGCNHPKAFAKDEHRRANV